MVLKNNNVFHSKNYHYMIINGSMYHFFKNQILRNSHAFGKNDTIHFCFKYFSLFFSFFTRDAACGVHAWLIVSNPLGIRNRSSHVRNDTKSHVFTISFLGQRRIQIYFKVMGCTPSLYLFRSKTRGGTPK